MDACGCDGFASIFDRRQAERDRDRYARRGPDATTRSLVDMIRRRGVVGATVLDVGSGTGVIDRELLRSGAVRAVLVDGSAASLRVARDEARRANLLDRMEFVEGDFTRIAGSIDRADVVTLDRVICCYPDVEGLVSLSSARASRLYGIVLPRNRWFVRLVLALENLRMAVTRTPYRAFAHSNAIVDALVMSEGLRPVDEARTWIWRVVLYERAPGRADAASSDAQPPPRLSRE
jgi:magnesium-protoporphyrin O-methyltransferase